VLDRLDDPKRVKNPVAFTKRSNEFRDGIKPMNTGAAPVWAMLGRSAPC
jgi:hypothetical protein